MKNCFAQGSPQLTTAKHFKELVKQAVTDHSLNNTMDILFAGLFIWLWSFISGYALLLSEDNCPFTQQVINQAIQKFVVMKEKMSQLIIYAHPYE